MSIESIDFSKLKKKINSSYCNGDKSLIIGYLHKFNIFNKSFCPDLIFYIIFIFYSEECDVFTTFFWRYSLSNDYKCLSGCGYGNILIDPNNKWKYNNYQWLIKINRLYTGRLKMGITSFCDTNYVWWHNKNIKHYEFCSKYSNIKTGDICILDLNMKTKQFKLYINGELNYVIFNNIDNTISYSLAIHTLEICDYVSIVAYSQFNNNNYHYNDNLLNYHREIPIYIHPKNRLLRIEEFERFRDYDKCMQHLLNDNYFGEYKHSPHRKPKRKSYTWWHPRRAVRSYEQEIETRTGTYYVKDEKVDSIQIKDIPH